LKELRERSSDCIESCCRIAMPFRVLIHMDARHKMAWKDDFKIVYFELTADDSDEYLAEKDTSAFEVE